VTGPVAANSTVPVPPLAFISKSDFRIVSFTGVASSSEEHPATKNKQNIIKYKFSIFFII
jgi:hypothetical protein